MSTREFAKTKFTKSGRPRMGTTITLHLDNGEWEDAKVVGGLFWSWVIGRTVVSARHARSENLAKA